MKLAEQTANRIRREPLQSNISSLGYAFARGQSGEGEILKHVFWVKNRFPKGSHTPWHTFQPISPNFVGKTCARLHLFSKY